MWTVATVQAALALGFAFELAWARAVWPFGGGPLTHLFVGSIFAAAAASTAWCLLRDASRALAGIALDYVVILSPLGIYALARAAGGADERGKLAAFGFACLAGAAFGAQLLRTARRAAWRDSRPTPRPVLWSFGVFAVVLAAVSAALIARASVLPWPVTGEQSTALGLMFLGAAAYFVYGLVHRRWENAGGQLAGFLAYDVVLIWPFLDRMPAIPPEFRTELVVYTAVVLYSGLLAGWYLLFAPATRGVPESAPLHAS